MGGREPTAAHREPRRFDPGWPVRPAIQGADPGARLPHALRGTGARRWYWGGAFSLLWITTFFGEILRADRSAVVNVMGMAVLLVFAAAFLVAAPLTWSMGMAGRLGVCATLFALSFTLVPWIGLSIVGLWTYVGVIVGMAVLPWRMTWVILLCLSGGALGATVIAAGEWDDSLLFLPAIVLSISMMMAAFARNLAAINQLRETQDTVAELAAERERSRVARDIHDILGHSLTVITVKAELAGRLIDVDRDRARTEIAEVEHLARGALADVRTTVHGFRGVSISGELVAARAALDAAGIAAEIPGATDQVPAERRELAGWVVREAVTNVIRHSGAAHCRIRLDARGIEVVDDGCGPGAGDGAGSGIAGLRERVEASGARMTVGRADARGGFRVRVGW